MVTGDNLMCGRYKKWMRLNWSINVSSLSKHTPTHSVSLLCHLWQRRDIKSAIKSQIVEKTCLIPINPSVAVYSNTHVKSRPPWHNNSQAGFGALTMGRNKDFSWLENSTERKGPFPHWPVTRERSTETDKPLCTSMPLFPVVRVWMQQLKLPLWDSVEKPAGRS